MSRLTSRQAKQIYQAHFASFLRFAFHELYPNASFKDNWHIDLLAHRLQQCAEGEITRLIVNMPPRHLKSFCASICLPVWLLGRNPTTEILVISGNRDLSARLALQRQRLAGSKRFQSLFPHIQMEPAKLNLATIYGGRCRAASVSEGLVGLGADFIILDDPMLPEDVKKKASRKQACEWYDSNVYQRLNDKQKGVIILVMQRLHEQDLTAHVLASTESWNHLRMAAIAMQDESYELPYTGAVGRKCGEALHPALEDRDQHQQALLKLGADVFLPQYQQDPEFVERVREAREGISWTAHPIDVPWRKEYGFIPPTMILSSSKNIVAYELFGMPSMSWPPGRDFTVTDAEAWGYLVEDRHKENDSPEDKKFLEDLHAQAKEHMDTMFIAVIEYLWRVEKVLTEENAPDREEILAKFRAQCGVFYRDGNLVTVFKHSSN